MTTSTKQVILVTLDARRTFFRTASIIENEHLEFPLNSRESVIAERAWMFSWAIGQKLSKVCGCSSFRVLPNKKWYYNYTESIVVYFTMISIYWLYTRLVAALTGRLSKLSRAERYTQLTAWSL